MVLSLSRSLFEMVNKQCKRPEQIAYLPLLIG